MASNFHFNIRDSTWNPSFYFYSIHSNLLIDIANSLDLILLKFTNQVFTRYLDNTHDMNSVIDLMFLNLNSLKLDNHTIHSKLCYSYNHTLLTVDK